MKADSKAAAERVHHTSACLCDARSVVQVEVELPFSQQRPARYVVRRNGDRSLAGDSAGAAALQARRERADDASRRCRRRKKSASTLSGSRSRRRRLAAIGWRRATALAQQVAHVWGQGAGQQAGAGDARAGPCRRCAALGRPSGRIPPRPPRARAQGLYEDADFGRRRRSGGAAPRSSERPWRARPTRPTASMEAGELLADAEGVGLQMGQRTFVGALNVVAGNVEVAGRGLHTPSEVSVKLGAGFGGLGVVAHAGGVRRRDGDARIASLPLAPGAASCEDRSWVARCEEQRRVETSARCASGAPWTSSRGSRTTCSATACSARRPGQRRDHRGGDHAVVGGGGLPDAAAAEVSLFIGSNLSGSFLMTPARTRRTRFSLRVSSDGTLAARRRAADAVLRGAPRGRRDRHARATWWGCGSTSRGTALTSRRRVRSCVACCATSRRCCRRGPRRLADAGGTGHVAQGQRRRARRRRPAARPLPDAGRRRREGGGGRHAGDLFTGVFCRRRGSMLVLEAAEPRPPAASGRCAVGSGEGEGLEQVVFAASPPQQRRR